MNEQEQVNKLNQEPSCDQVSTPMGIRAASPREAILQRLEAEESHCISRLNRLREAKLEVVMSRDRECALFDKIYGVFGDKW